MLDKEHELNGGVQDAEDRPAFQSRRKTAIGPAAMAGEVLYRCKALIAALDGLHSTEDRVDRIMTDVLETGGSWQVGGPGEVSPCPVLVEIQVHGVRALGRDIDQAIANWVTAARRVGEWTGGDL